MTLFSKKITTKKDPLVELQAALTAAIAIAIENKISFAQLARELNGRGSHFARMDEARISDWGNRASTPEEAELVRQAEEIRAERALREQQASFRKSQNEAGQRDAISRGRVL